MKLYLASPYSSQHPLIREGRFLQVCNKAAELMLEGHIVFSPVAHSHYISTFLKNSNDTAFWLKQDMSFIAWCDELWVYALDGWTKSKGVTAEINRAREIGKTVKIIE